MKNAHIARLHVGTSGWLYPDWAGRFYPEGAAQRGWLAFYQRQFDTVELNVTFYRLPREIVFRGWAERAPAGFRFAVKAPRLVTHLQRLRDSAESVTIFLERARLLVPHLGPVLWQLPPGLAPDLSRLRGFLALLPRDLTHAFEFRHPGWFQDAVYRMLAERGCALVVWHMQERETPAIATGDTVYLRFHGTTSRYGGAYRAAVLRPWVERTRSWLAEGREVWAYFNNDVGGHAVRDARRLRSLVVAPPTPRRTAAPATRRARRA